MSETTFAQTEGKRYSCPLCGGGLQYDIGSGQLKCNHCGNLTHISQVFAEPENDATMEVTEFRCPQCGAAVYSSDTAVTSFCSFCGSDVVLTAKLTRTKRPAAIVPFRITREQCEEHYRNHLSKYHLVPKALKSAETISHFRAVYVPFWSYSVKSKGTINLKATSSYTRGDTRYDETYDLSIDANIDQNDILYDASTAFEDETAAMLRHNSNHAKPFSSAYLSGFFAQAADVPAEAYYSEVAATAIRLFIEKIKEQNKYDSVETAAAVSRDFGLPEPQYEQKLIMLPVWLLAHRESDRVVYTAINGFSGEVVCDVPVSMSRVVSVTAGLTAGIFALLYLFLTVKPDILLTLCALLSLITQFSFTGMHNLLHNRKTRAFEPHFSNGKAEFIGPAQLLLNNKGLNNGGLQTAKKVGTKALSILIVIIGFIGFRSLSLIMSVIMSSSVRSFDFINNVILAILLIIMLIHAVNKGFKSDSGIKIPRIISLLACGAGLVSLITKQSEDWLFYGFAIAMLAAAIWELTIIIRAHNEYSSRPVPYFDGKENNL